MHSNAFIDYQISDDLFNWEINKELAKKERDLWILNNYDQLIFSLETTTLGYKRTDVVYVTDRKTRDDKYKILFYVPGQAQLYLEDMKNQYKRRLQ